jgi:PQQ-like domain
MKGSISHRTYRSPRRAPLAFRNLVAAASLFVLLVPVVAAVVTYAGTANASDAHLDATTSWTVYHGDPLGSGVDTSGVTFSPPDPDWTSPTLDGQLYGEPVEATGRVYVATENDTVYALAANSGAVLWSTHVGTPVPSGDLPCGDITPTVGITGTPVLDQADREVFAVAEELVNGNVAHYLVGLDMYSGALLLDQPVDPPGSTPDFELQRTGLNLDGSAVVFGFGGNEGSCAPDHGWIVSVPEGGGSASYYNTTGSTSNGTLGGVWMGGAAPEVDGQGNIWTGTGNSTITTPYDGGDSVVELSAQLAQDQLFAPTDWLAQNQGDQDLGSTAPAFVANGTIFQVGKSNTGYLLNQSDLGGIGGQITSAPVCTGAYVDGGHAVIGTVVYIGCQAGVQAIQTNGSLSVLWQAPGGITGPPIAAGGLIWSIGNGDLDGMDPSGGAVVQSVPLGPEANHFPTPSVGDGLLLAPTSDQVVAFSGSAGQPGPPSPAPTAPPDSSYWQVASDGGIFSYGNAGFYGSAGSLRLVRPVVGMAATSDGTGYWLVASDGGIFSFGDAHFDGSMGGRPLNKPIVGMAATPDGAGYWLVASDGGIFSFGDAAFHGSMGGQHLNSPVVGISAARNGGGYWEVAADGGIFNFGDAGFFGSPGGTRLNAPVVGMTTTPDGGGYWITGSDGGIFSYGDANFEGSMGGSHLNAPVVGMASAN